MLPTRNLSLGALRVDTESGLVTGAGSAFALPPLELALLLYLRDRPGRAVPRDELLRAVWGHTACVVTRAVDLTVSRLRKRLGPAAGAHISAIHGEGYAFVPSLGGTSGGPAPRAASTRLVGREDDLAFLRTWAAQADSRWLTVVGPRGIGKSRLLAEFCQDTGACLVSLEHAATPEDVASAVCGALSLRPATLGHFGDFLRLALGGGNRLILLDSVDRARAAVAALQPAFEACPGVAVVASGRERVGFAGETQRLLSPLGAEAASALFADASGGGSADAGPAGGVPLGILLYAAAWRAGVELAEEAGAGIRSSCLASWARIPDAARSALAGLSIFRGEFDAAAAAAVASACPEVLRALEREHLLQTHGDTHSLHPGIREFAAERLRDGERERVEERHMVWALGLLDPALLALRGAARRAHRATSLAARGEIEIAWRRAVRGRRADVLAQAAPGLHAVLLATGLVRTAALLLREARDVPANADERTRLAIAEAACLAHLGEGLQGLELLRTLDGSEEGGPDGARRCIARARVGLGVQPDDAQIAAGDDALRLATVWLPLAERCETRCAVLGQRARANLACPSLAEATALLRDARATGDPDLIAAALFVRGIVRFRWSPSRAAFADLRAARRLQEQEGDEGPLALTLVWETTTAHVIGHRDDAVHLERTAEALLERHGAVQLLWAMRRNIGLAQIAHGHFDAAEARLRTCLTATERVGLDRLHAHCHESLALCLVQAGRAEAAVRELDECVAHRGTDYVTDGLVWWIRALAHLDEPSAAYADAQEGLRRQAASPTLMPELRLDLELVSAFADMGRREEDGTWPQIVARLLAPRVQPASRGIALWMAAQVASRRAPRLAGQLLGYAATVERFRGATPRAYAGVRADIVDRIGVRGLAEAEAAGARLTRAGLAGVLRARRGGG